MANVIATQTGVRIIVSGQGLPGPPGPPGSGGDVEDLSTQGAVGSVPTSDGANGLIMTVPSGSGNVVSPGGETAGRVTQFTGANTIDETATTATELATAVTHSTTVTGNPHNLDAADTSSEPAGAIATHALDGDAHHAEAHTVASHSDTTATGAELNTLTDGSTTALHAHAAPTIAHSATTGQTADDHHPQVHTIVSHDTTATGTNLTELTDGSTTALHGHAAIAHSATTGQTTDDHHPQVHTIVSHDTTGTGANLTELTDGSTTTLHGHAAPSIAHSATTGQTTDDHHPQAHTVVSHSDTTATGLELDELTDGSETTLHSHAGGGGPHAASHSDGQSDEVTVENLATSGAVGSVPTSDGAGGLTMSVPAGSGNVVSPGGETSGNIASFTGANTIDEIAVTEANLVELTDGSTTTLHQHAGGGGLTGEETLETGVITGLGITINGGDAATFDVAAGDWVIVDWTTPSPPTRTTGTFAGATGVALDNIGAAFTTIHINASNTLVQTPGVITTPQQWRQTVQLQVAVHTAGTVIENVSSRLNLAYQKSAALFDWAQAIGPDNVGNTVEAAATDLTVKKVAGVTTAPMNNAGNDRQNTSQVTGVEVDPIANLNYSFRDGVGGYSFDATPTDLQVGLWDDNTGTPVAVSPSSRFTNTRFFYISSTNQVIPVYGQTLYTSLVDAVQAIPSEVMDINPNFANLTLVTVISAAGNTTDLTDSSDVVFTTPIGGLGGAGAGSTTFLGLLDTDDVSYAGAAGQAVLGNPGESGLILTQLDHDVHLDNVGTNDHAAIDSHIADPTAHTGLLDLAGTRAMTGDLNLDGNDIQGGIILGGTLTDVGLIQYMTEVGSIGFFGDPTSPDAIVSAAPDFDVATGIGAFHTGPTLDSLLGIGDWPASNGNTIALGEIVYVGVEWNSGTPQVIFKSTNIWTNIQEWRIGIVERDTAGVHVSIAPPRLSNFASLMDQRIFETEVFKRANGLNLSTSGLTIQRSDGRGWVVTTPIDYAAYDTSASNTIDRYLVGTGAFNVELNQTTFEDASYDDGTDVLAALGNNRYGVRWLYFDLATGELALIYGTSNTTDIAVALREPIPSSVPPRLDATMFIYGRIVFQRASGQSEEAQDRFGTGFSPGGGGDGDVSGPTGGVVADEIPVYADTTGKAIAGSGILSANVALTGHTIVSHDTTATGANLTTLTDGSTTALHNHTISVAHSSTTGRTADDHHSEVHTIASHSDTTATGAELDELTDASETTLHSHADPTLAHSSLSGIGTDDHHAQAHTVDSHSDTATSGAQLDTLSGGSSSDADALHEHPKALFAGMGSISVIPHSVRQPAAAPQRSLIAITVSDLHVTAGSLVDSGTFTFEILYGASLASLTSLGTVDVTAGNSTGDFNIASPVNVPADSIYVFGCTNVGAFDGGATDTEQRVNIAFSGRRT